MVRGEQIFLRGADCRSASGIGIFGSFGFDQRKLLSRRKFFCPILSGNPHRKHAMESVLACAALAFDPVIPKRTEIGDTVVKDLQTVLYSSLHCETGRVRAAGWNIRR